MNDKTTTMLPPFVAVVWVLVTMGQPSCDSMGGGADGDADTDSDIPTFEGKLADMDEGYELAVDGQHVYWSETGHAILKRVPVGSGEVEEIINGAGDGHPGALAVDDDYLYIATEFDPDQLMLRFDKGSETLETFDVGCGNLAASDNYVFCTRSGATDMRRVAKTDLAYEAYQVDGMDLSDVEIAAGGGIFAAGDGQIVAVVDDGLSGTTEYDLSPYTLTSISVGNGAAWVGAVDYSSDEVVILRLSGGEVELVHAVDTVVTQFVSGLAVDETHIYYGVTSSFSSADNEYFYDGRVESVPVDGGSAENCSSDNYPQRVVVDGGAVYWSEVVKGSGGDGDIWSLHRALK